jgi:hypothetical protein
MTLALRIKIGCSVLSKNVVAFAVRNIWNDELAMGELAGTGTMMTQVTVVDEDVVVGSDRARVARGGCQSWVIYLSGATR